MNDFKSVTFGILYFFEQKSVYKFSHGHMRILKDLETLATTNL